MRPLGAVGLDAGAALQLHGLERVGHRLGGLLVQRVPLDLAFQLVEARGQLDLADHAQGFVLVHDGRHVRQLDLFGPAEQRVAVHVDVGIGDAIDFNLSAMVIYSPSV